MQVEDNNFAEVKEGSWYATNWILLNPQGLLKKLVMFK